MPKNYPVGVKATLPPRSKTHENIGLQKKWSKGKLFRIKFWTRWFLSIFLSEQYFDFKSLSQKKGNFILQKVHAHF